MYHYAKCKGNISVILHLEIGKNKKNCVLSHYYSLNLVICISLFMRKNGNSIIVRCLPTILSFAYKIILSLALRKCTAVRPVSQSVKLFCVLPLPLIKFRVPEYRSQIKFICLLNWYTSSSRVSSSGAEGAHSSYIMNLKDFLMKHRALFMVCLKCYLIFLFKLMFSSNNHKGMSQLGNMLYKICSTNLATKNRLLNHSLSHTRTHTHTQD